MNKPTPSLKRCAIYTRKSSEEGLEQSFNSLDAQREACESYIKSQQHEGWTTLATQYNDGGFSGGNTERPALKTLINDVKLGKIDVVIVYKVDRLSRSLADFVKIIDLFDQHDVSFVSVTQQFNTSSSMGRLTLNVLLSFAQFEREVTSERIRDKIAASKKRGMWMGGVVPLGYDVIDKKLVVNNVEAKIVKHIYERYIKLGTVRKLKEELDAEGYLSKQRKKDQCRGGGKPFGRGALYALLKNPLYIGKVAHQGNLFEGQHAAIVDTSLWDTAQTLLNENKQNNQTRNSVKDPSFFSGIIFDDNNNSMSPAHTRKGNRRYRYYVSQAVLQYREADAGSVIRISANKIEGPVIKRLMQCLRTPNELLNAFSHLKLSAKQQSTLILNSKNAATNWDVLSPANKISCLKIITRKIMVGCKSIDITLSRAGMTEYLINSNSDNKTSNENVDDEFLLSIPTRLKHCNSESKLIIGDKYASDNNPTTICAIQNALKKALSWNQALTTGEVSNMAQLAKQENVTQRYIAHLIKLAFLAPDIIEAIIKGDIPKKLTLGRLKEGFAYDWDEQRKELEFNHQ
ncbi:MAG TPA: recombinase family protein [Thiotrichaceae bacterium]|jgi:DNA invertase Pin-like site-specific DNA recombinase|nr:recombinase family protein [Thiotrichaceae bacterium]HIM07991.1 recombinase family protein [Gammaproteobacteria bacterium]